MKATRIWGWTIAGIGIAGWIQQPGQEFHPEPNPAWLVGVAIGVAMVVIGSMKRG